MDPLKRRTRNSLSGSFALSFRRVLGQLTCLMARCTRKKKNARPTASVKTLSTQTRIHLSFVARCWCLIDHEKWPATLLEHFVLRVVVFFFLLLFKRLAISTIKDDDRIAIPSDQQGHLRALQTAKIHLSIKLELNNASRSLFDPVK